MGGSGGVRGGAESRKRKRQMDTQTNQAKKCRNNQGSKKAIINSQGNIRKYFEDRTVGGESDSKTAL